ncbi:DNA-3-methyladenine glycosylase I [Convivina praedatoris]|uniref:DNA-3-methyladenine glycosylase 1 n=1 Tax=Convivina praedatoris TaxID=2880963 RepID=A0ABM9D4W4_9LACO|nr:DNA-3-methyladenine glycosylase I [Convivina sp. LMG 32447]CAH1856673.1 DNA-3-methyladenine glycosylase 1 [Convivina sp. LMG 32447]CAH1857071.1 DNA-3-methyladenine glycosylase 1 [Convivina sp. LMG 32447]CAH1857290.1 DNA-3-methyladenine glycosylase 1 [Convivina sp. LMG 32447]
MTQRCSWVANYSDSELMQNYHDLEWGCPCHDEQRLFEMLCLEMFQSGLSWAIVLSKRENLRRAFFNFDIKSVASMTVDQVKELLANTSIIRHRGKIEAVINNARILQQWHRDGKNLDQYIWQTTQNQIIDQKISDYHLAPSKTVISEKLAKQFKSNGFKFVGPTVLQAYLQAVGIINAHELSCDFH